MVIEKSLRENFFPMRNALDRSYRDGLLIGSKVHVGNAVFRKLYVMWIYICLSTVYSLQL